jgi:hypothetical protein
VLFSFPIEGEVIPLKEIKIDKKTPHTSKVVSSLTSLKIKSRENIKRQYPQYFVY